MKKLLFFASCLLILFFYLTIPSNVFAQPCNFNTVCEPSLGETCSGCSDCIGGPVPGSCELTIGCDTGGCTTEFCRFQNCTCRDTNFDGVGECVSGCNVTENSCDANKDGITGNVGDYCDTILVCRPCENLAPCGGCISGLVCVGGRCAAPTPTPAPFPTPFPQPALYRCEAGFGCIRDDINGFTTDPNCEGFCPAPTPTPAPFPTPTPTPIPTSGPCLERYSCGPTLGCIRDNSGPYCDLASCQAVCKPPPPPGGGLNCGQVKGTIGDESCGPLSNIITFPCTDPYTGVQSTCSAPGILLALGGQRKFCVKGNTGCTFGTNNTKVSISFNPTGICSANPTSFSSSSPSITGISTATGLNVGETTMTATFSTYCGPVTGSFYCPITAQVRVIPAPCSVDLVPSFSTMLHPSTQTFTATVTPITAGTTVNQVQFSYNPASPNPIDLTSGTDTIPPYTEEVKTTGLEGGTETLTATAIVTGPGFTNFPGCSDSSTVNVPWCVADLTPSSSTIQPGGTQTLTASLSNLIGAVNEVHFALNPASPNPLSIPQVCTTIQTPYGPETDCNPGDVDRSAPYTVTVEANTGQTGTETVTATVHEQKFSPFSHFTACTDSAFVTVATPSPTFTPTPTPTPAGWFQTFGGDVHSGGGISQPTNPGPNATWVVTGGSFTNFTSAQNWLVSGYTASTARYDYDYFNNRLTNTQQLSSITDGTTISDNTVYKVTGDVALTSNGANFSGKRVVVLVDGNLAIASNFNPVGGGVAFIVRGSISFSPTVSTIRAILLSNGSLSTGASSTAPLSAQGTWVSYAGFSLQRTLGPTTPSEIITYDPQMLISLSSLLGVSAFNWQEVAP